ncbi:MAG: ATP-binding protein, partial [Dehalococcoidia bacterium]
MLNPDIEQITKEELQALVENEVAERKTLEYKQALSVDSESAKKEFLADVSSFANASGGDLVFGITEDKTTGVPKSLDGINIENPDQEILRLESMIRDGVEPRIPSIRTRSIPLENSKVALVIRIPKSWISPHRVT